MSGPLRVHFPQHDEVYATGTFPAWVSPPLPRCPPVSMVLALVGYALTDAHSYLAVFHVLRSPVSVFFP